jgi:hypothetical protein
VGWNSKDPVDSWFMERFDRWSHSFFEYADDLSDLGALVCDCFHPRYKLQRRKEQLDNAFNRANCFFVLLHMLQFSIPQYRAAIPVIHELCKALCRCKETGETSEDLDTAGEMLLRLEAAAWFAAAWTEAAPLPTTPRKTASKRKTATASSDDIKDAYHTCKARGLKPDKDNVRKILREKGKTRANGPLNAELRRIES